MAIPVLFWFAEYSNATSVGIVVLCFLAMAIFLGLIIRMSESSGSRGVALGVEQRSMVRIENPFFVQLVNTSKRLEDGLTAQLSTLCPCTVWVLWGPRIQALHDLLLTPGWSIRKQCFLEEAPLPELGTLHYDKLEFQSSGDHCLTLRCPETVNAAALGSMPRQRYPVSIFVFLPESEEDEADRASSEECAGELRDPAANSNHIIGLVSIVHLRDEVVVQSSHLIAQYIKTHGVPIYSLQPLYLSNVAEHSGQARKLKEEEEEAADIGSGLSVSSNAELSPGSSLQDAGTQSSSGDAPSWQQTDSAGHSVPDKSSVPACKCHNCEGHCGGNSEGHCGGNSEGHCGGNSEGHCGGDSKGDCEGYGEGRSKGYCEGHGEGDGEGRSEGHCEGHSEGYCGGHTAKTVDEICPPCPTSSDGNSSNNLSLRKRNIAKESSSGHCAHEDDRNASGQDDVQQLPDCVVCQTRKARCVLLPCRHACVCHGCFKLLEKCPMCRGAVHSFFFLEDAGEDKDGEDGEEEMLEEMQQRAVVYRLGQVWNRWNLQLNTWLGFH